MSNNQKKKLIFNAGDNRSALIFWPNQKSYSIVPMSGFEKHENYVLDQNYKVKWNQQKMLAVLKFIGDKKECEDFESSLLQYEQDPSLKANINKKQSTKQTNKANAEEFDHELQKSQISNLKNKIKEKEDLMKDLQQTLKQSSNDQISK